MVSLASGGYVFGIYLFSQLGKLSGGCWSGCFLLVSSLSSDHFVPSYLRADQNDLIKAIHWEADEEREREKEEASHSVDTRKAPERLKSQVRSCQVKEMIETNGKVKWKRNEL